MVEVREIQKELLAQECGNIKAKGFDYLKKITAVDYATYLEVVYITYNTETKAQELFSIKLPIDNPEITTITHIYPAADWYEREMSEMFGIKIIGGNGERLLLEEWNGTDPPLRKSFAWGKEYKRREI